MAFFEQAHVSDQVYKHGNRTFFQSEDSVSQLNSSNGRKIAHYHPPENPRPAAVSELESRDTFKRIAVRSEILN